MPLKVSHGIGAWIKDFQKSDAPQFKGKSDKERRDQAIAAYLSAKRGDQKENYVSDAQRKAVWASRNDKKKNEATNDKPPFDGPYKKKQSIVPGKHGEGPSTAKHLAKMGMKQAEKKPVKESTEQLDELSPGLLGRYTRARGSLNITKKQSKMKARAHQKMRDKTKDLSAIAGKYSNPADLTKTEKKYNEETELGEQYKVGDFVKHDGKIHRVFGVNGTTLHTGTYYGKDKYGGTNRLHVSKVTKAPTPKGEGVEQTEQFSEETTFEVEVEGLPTMYVKAKSPGEVKANLRKIVKQPSMITGVSRVTDADMKKVFRDKAQGRDEVEEGTSKIDELKKSTLGSYIKKAHQSKSFTAADIGRMGSRGDTSSDEYKKVKDKHKNRSIGIDRAVDRMTKEQAPVAPVPDKKYIKGTPEYKAYMATKKTRVGHPTNEISGELAQRYHDKAVKAPAPKDKKDPLKHTLKRFASMQKAQDIIHKSELKRIGGQK